LAASQNSDKVAAIFQGNDVTTARTERRLTAILAANVAGYGQLVHADDEGTLALLKAHQHELLDPKIVEHRGRIVKTTGSGFLAEFSSVIDAMSCAVEIQRGMARRNLGVSPEKRILLRIGVNVGDVIIDDGDIFGDGVNVAARLEAFAEPGGICVSGRVWEDAHGTLGISFDDAGEQKLKNIARPVHVYRIRPGNDAWQKPAPALSLPDKPSIAVLPFQNMSGDPEQDYFADGIVEDIITALSRYRWLFVIARNSSFTYKGRAVDVKQIGRELGVRYVVEGSVRKAGNRVRITAQLIEAASGMHLWADRFDGALEDVFGLQDSVTTKIVGQIAPKLEQAEIERVKRKRTDSLDAYDCYLRGLALVHSNTRDTVGAALRLFRSAIALDPEFAAAHGMAAWCYVLTKANGWLTDASDVAEAARLARRGSELGKDDAVALYTAGFALAFVAEEVDDGAAFIEQALRLNPNLAPAWQFSGWVNVYLGKHELAIAHAQNSMRLSPLDPLTYGAQAAIAIAHFFCSRYDEATLWAEKSVREQPNFVSATRFVVASHALAGRIEEAKKALARLLQLDPHMRMSNVHKMPLRRPEDLARWEEAFRRVGLPD
jgi:TolB-like protein/tetratricopeptide (TPR) repeat protein